MIDQTDKPEPNEIVWENSWRTGGPARTTPSLSSFDFVDEILRKLANKTTFPNMKAIVVAGHSAGGQFANRYEMSNKIHDTLGVPVTYVVANPSSYAWPDAVRPLAQGDADPAAAKEGWNQRDADDAAAAHEVHVRAVRRVQGAELQPLAVGLREPRPATPRTSPTSS